MGRPKKINVLPKIKVTAEEIKPSNEMDKIINWTTHREAMNIVRSCLNKQHGILVPFDELNNMCNDHYNKDFIDLVKLYYKKIYK